jgi:hypothetical protein
MPHFVGIEGVLQEVCPPYVENTEERQARHDSVWHDALGRAALVRG